MTKTIFIEGMACMHCQKSVEQTLTTIDGVKGVTVSLEEKCAKVELDTDVSNDVLKTAITDIGFEVTNIK